MSEEDIADTLEVFGRTAARARVFDFDTVQIHGARGADLLLILRPSQWKQEDFCARLATPSHEMAQWLVPLIEASVEVLHCS